MAHQRQHIGLLGRALADNFRYWAGGRWRRCRPAPTGSCRVAPDFFGICVASAPDPAFDDYIIARLRELGISHVRLDFTYDSRGSFGERFLKRLMDASFGVCLHLVQPAADVKTLASPQVQDRWRAFVAETFQAHAARLEMVEIGATCNRRRWSGYTPASFLLSWQIAWEEAQHYPVRLAAPNVTDFEPLYNVAILAELKRGGMLPAVHTDNLFVERVTEPEAFDHRIMGRRLGALLRFNLVRKAQVLMDIGRWAGVPETVCAHVSWSLRRIARRLDRVEEKQADYLARYAGLAAASGALRRLYWGPLIGQREGLIDDGTSEYPDIPHVAYYGHCRGRRDGYRLRPAFFAMKTVGRFLTGAEFLRKIPTGPGLEILEFAVGKSGSGQQPSTLHQQPSAINHPPSTILHVAWTTNGNAAEAALCYPPAELYAAQAYSRDGDQLDHVPPFFTESPVYLVWPAAGRESSEVSDQRSSAASTIDHSWRVASHPPLVARGEPSAIPLASDLPGIVPGLRLASIPGMGHAPFRRLDMSGCVLIREAGAPFDPAPLMDMLLSGPAPGTGDARALPRSAIVLRDARNRVWSVPAPGDRTRRLAVKQFKPLARWRRLIRPRQADRAQRSWNGAQELLRRGIPTPQPIAFLHAAERPCRIDCFYVCRAFEGGWSVREAFTAFSLGATRFQGKTTAELYAAIAQFLGNIHDRGVFFRDLSAGNLLFRCAPENELEFALIDTARARFYPHALGLTGRLGDLVRICHPLHWEGRTAFVGTYMQYIGRRFGFRMKIPFAWYDAKHWLKNRLKKWRR